LAWLSGQNDPCADVSFSKPDSAQPSEAHGCNFYDVLPDLRWRSLVKLIPVLVAAGLAAAVFTAGVSPMLPPLMDPGNRSSKNTANIDRAQPSVSTESKANAGSSEEFASRWLPDIQKQPKTASMSSNLSAPSHYGPSPLWAAPSSQPKKIPTVRIRFDGSMRPDSLPTAGPNNTISQASPSVPVVVPPIGSQSSSSGPVGDGATSQSSWFPVLVGNAAGAQPSGAYVVQVASERSAAEAHASFRTLQAKFPNQLGGREPIVTRTDIAGEGIHYRAMVGPFVSLENAVAMCNTLKAAGGSCHIERD